VLRNPKDVAVVSLDQLLKSAYVTLFRGLDELALVQAAKQGDVGAFDWMASIGIRCRIFARKRDLLS